jgi:GNAT superfamily N-acetyltransferase
VAIRLAESDAEIQNCFPVMHELRPQLESDQFVGRVRLQQQTGYLLAFLEDNGEVVSVAGFRIGENLAWKRFVYVDDLVTKAELRSKGYGLRLFEWLVEFARRNDCDEFHLDSGVQRFGAHRFYLMHGMRISSHHFAMEL